MKIVIDCCGNDLGARPIIDACVKALNDFNDLEFVLSGPNEELKSLLSNFDYDESKIEIIDADQVITNDESPTEAFKAKQNSSIVKAFEALKQREDIVGLLSCGSTGAVLTGAFLKIGRIHGISRPALCPILPAKNGESVMLIDSGANVDCKPINLSHFAIMASIYAKCYQNKDNPRVALLNIGTEDKKGNEFSHECFDLLKKTPVNFVGNMEARDFASGKYDIIVADGFYGNILLKSVEGTAKFVMDTLKTEVKSRFFSKLGALFMKKSFKSMKKKMNYNNYGGAAFLGVKKLVVKGHGASDETAVYNAILQVKTLAEQKLCEKIENEVLALGDKLNG